MATGDAFGTIRGTLTVLTPDGHEVRADEFQEGIDDFDKNELLSPEAHEYLYAYVRLVGRSSEHWYHELDHEISMVINHAVNDILILIEAVADGSGRTAARTSRAMYEHLLHLLEISHDPSKGVQYAAHAHVTASQLAEAAIGLDRLERPLQRRERARLQQMAKRARRPLAQALALYGPRFRSRWTGAEGVFDLAKRHGLIDDYGAYRILSAVLHGSAGALLGTRRPIGEGTVTHRVGPDLALLPSAYLLGVTWWRALVAHLPEPPRSPEWSIEFSKATDVLLDIYPEVFERSRRVDNKLWPQNPVPASRTAVIAVYPSKKVRWYLHDMRTNALWPAEPVGEVPDWVASIAHRDEVEEQLRLSRGRPVTFCAPWAAVSAIEGRRPASAEAILLPHDVFGEVGVPVPNFSGDRRRSSGP